MGFCKQHAAAVDALTPYPPARVAGKGRGANRTAMRQSKNLPPKANPLPGRGEGEKIWRCGCGAQRRRTHNADKIHPLPSWERGQGNDVCVGRKDDIGLVPAQEPEKRQPGEPQIRCIERMDGNLGRNVVKQDTLVFHENEGDVKELAIKRMQEREGHSFCPASVHAWSNNE